MEEKIIGISFAGVSTKPQAEEVSISDQHRENEELAKRIGAIVRYRLTVPGESRGDGADIYSLDDACNQGDGKGEAYRQLREIAERGQAQVLIFRSLDRLARNQEFAISVTGFLRRHGIAIYNRSSPPVTLDANEQRNSVMTMIIESIDGARAQGEVTEITERHRKGMRARVKEKGLFSGILPDGYTYNVDVDHNGKVTKTVVLTDRAQMFKRGFEMTLAGYGTVHIERYFDSIGFKTSTGLTWESKGAKWIPYLKRAWTYAGWVSYNQSSPKRGTGREPIRVKGHHPAIITDEQARDILEIVANNALGPRASFLLSGIVRCEVCDSKCFADTTGSGRRSYRCYQCSRMMIQTPMIQSILDYFHNRDPDEVLDKKKSKDYTKDIERAKARITRLENSKQRAHDLFIDGDIEYSRDRLIEKLTELDAQIANEEKNIADMMRSGDNTEEIVKMFDELVRVIERLLNPQTEQERSLSNRLLKKFQIRVYANFETRTARATCGLIEPS